MTMTVRQIIDMLQHKLESGECTNDTPVKVFSHQFINAMRKSATGYTKDIATYGSFADRRDCTKDSIVLLYTE